MNNAKPIYPGLAQKLAELKAFQRPAVELVCQGRAFRGGRWLDWHAISATVYQNRESCPRDGYETRIVPLSAAAKDTAP